jgi:DNA polymerase V
VTRLGDGLSQALCAVFPARMGISQWQDKAGASLANLNEAVTEFTSRAAHKLRGQGSLAGQVLVFIRTSPLRPEAQYSRSITMSLRRPSADTGVIVAAALRSLRAIYRPGYQLVKAGLTLFELQPNTVLQAELDLQAEEASDRSGLIAAMDDLNQRYGRGTVQMASAGLLSDRRAWAMK